VTLLEKQKLDYVLRQETLTIRVFRFKKVINKEFCNIIQKTPYVISEYQHSIGPSFNLFTKKRKKREILMVIKMVKMTQKNDENMIEKIKEQQYLIMKRKESHVTNQRVFIAIVSMVDDAEFQFMQFNSFKIIIFSYNQHKCYQYATILYI
jgi:hypothetical protein